MSQRVESRKGEYLITSTLDISTEYDNFFIYVICAGTCDGLKCRVNKWIELRFTSKNRFHIVLAY